jgi:FkbM family methyltransferase
MEQYAYRNGSMTVQAQPGDTVIEGGGCWGNSALYFADIIGAQGKVFCFEFVQDNLGILRQNLRLNPPLAGRIQVVSEALWDKSGDAVGYQSRGPRTWLESTEGFQQSLQVSTVSLDDFVREEGVGRVDYIKLDTEGSELRALQGAEETLRAFRPSLAISLHHRREDYYTIPQFLNELDLGYELLLEHFTIHGLETILFARPKAD